MRLNEAIKKTSEVSDKLPGKKWGVYMSGCDPDMADKGGL